MYLVKWTKVLRFQDFRLILFFSFAGFLMLGQVVRSHESLPTDGTSESFITSVSSNVSLKLVGPREWLATHGPVTNKRLVVTCQRMCAFIKFLFWKESISKKCFWFFNNELLSNREIHFENKWKFIISGFYQFRTHFEKRTVEKNFQNPQIRDKYPKSSVTFFWS